MPIEISLIMVDNALIMLYNYSCSEAHKATPPARKRLTNGGPCLTNFGKIRVSYRPSFVKKYSNLEVNLLFAENLARLQAERGETNYRLAKEIGVHQTSVQNWKSGIKPHPKHVKLVADHYGVTVDELLKDNGE